MDRVTGPFDGYHIASSATEIGAALGRMELRILVSGLASRFPGLRLEAANEELEWSPGPVFRTPVRMAVRW